MNRSVAIAMLMLAAGCKSKRVDDERSADRQARPIDAAIDESSARYRSFDEIIAAGQQAHGAVAVVSVLRGEVHKNSFTAYSCDANPRRLFLTLPTDLRDSIRALPTRNTNACPRVLVRVRSVGSAGVSGYRAEDGSWKTREDGERLIMADTLAILGVTPRPASPAPPGTKYGTVDDIVLADYEAGDLAEVPLRAHPSVGTTSVYMRPCDESTEPEVRFPDEKLDGALARTTACHAIRFRLRARRSPGLAGEMVEADLVSIGAAVETAR